MEYSIEGIATRLKKARLKKGMSQKAFGKEIGMPQSHISKIESGLVDFQASTLIQMARVLDLELMLISRENITAVEAIETYSQDSVAGIPAYRLGEGEQD